MDPDLCKAVDLNTSYNELMKNWGVNNHQDKELLNENFVKGNDLELSEKNKEPLLH